MKFTLSNQHFSDLDDQVEEGFIKPDANVYKAAQSLIDGFKSFHLDKIVVPVEKSSLIYMQVGIIRGSEPKTSGAVTSGRRVSIKGENNKCEMNCTPELDYV